MANWQKVLDLKDVWDDLSSKRRIWPLRKAGPEMADRIIKLYPGGPDKELLSIVAALRNVKSGRQLDAALKRLYDWGDVHHRLFVRCI